MTYSEQLKDERWKRKRLKILAYADDRCQICGAEQVPLQVHHSYYRDGMMAWEYPDGSLVALCDDCHGRVVHGLEGKPKQENHISGRRNIIQESITDIIFSFLDEMPNEGQSRQQFARALEAFLAMKSMDVSFTTCLRAQRDLLAMGKLTIGQDGLIRKS